MKLVLLPALAACMAGASMARAQTIAPDQTQPSLAVRIATLPKDLPRASGPEPGYALRLAQAAIHACTARGGGVSVLVTDSLGVAVVLLAGEGGERTQLINQTKANTVVRYRIASGDVKRQARTDARLAGEIARDPDIGEARLGAYPLITGGKFVGALSVSGLADGGNEECARQAMARVPLP